MVEKLALTLAVGSVDMVVGEEGKVHRMCRSLRRGVVDENVSLQRRLGGGSLMIRW